MKRVELVKRVGPNENGGRDFACGDIHGYFHVLEKLLEEVGFDKTKDRLFSVGDLVDRGPYSIRFSNYIFEPWFFAVRGNHEQIQLQHHENGYRVQNGGRWFVNEWEDSQREIRLLIGQLPIAIEVETKHGLVGIVHANVPGDDWGVFTRSLVDWHEEVVNYATWDRSRWRYSSRVTKPVTGVAYLFCGHCAHDEIRISHNVYDLDTGCGYEGGKLTLWSIDDMKIAAEGTYVYDPVPEPVGTGW
jgi:serine/threonine protein phosphatase 1